MDLADVKNNQEKFKPYLGEIKRKETKSINQKSKKALRTILKCFIKQETKLLNLMTIILQLCLRQNIEQLKEHDTKYFHQNKCFKD